MDRASRPYYPCSFGLINDSLGLLGRMGTVLGPLLGRIDWAWDIPCPLTRNRLTLAILDGKNQKGHNAAVVKKKRVLSLFSGCGGLDLGFLGDFKVLTRAINKNIHPHWKASKKTFTLLPKTDFEIVFANDILSEARDSYVPYFSKKSSQPHFHAGSIVNLVKEAHSGDFRFPETDVVIGGFPCQDFSVAGNRLGLRSKRNHLGDLEEDTPTEENRGSLYIWMKKVIEMTLPKVFIAENVKGLVSLGDVKKVIERDFQRVGQGYTVLDAKVLHAAEYGVPQTRERVFFIGFNNRYLQEDVIEKLRKGEISAYPPTTHYLPGEEVPGKRKFVSVKEAFQGLEEPSITGDPSQQAYSKAKYYGRHVQGQIEVNLAGLGPTIRAEHHGNIEFRRLEKASGGKNEKELQAGLQQRRLTVRECARLQTFPDDYEFVKSKTTKKGYLSASKAYKVIGNAVPPLLGFHLAWNLQNIWVSVFGEQDANKRKHKSA